MTKMIWILFLNCQWRISWKKTSKYISFNWL